MRRLFASCLAWSLPALCCLAAEPAALPYHEQVLKDRPVAYFRLGERQGKTVASLVEPAADGAPLAGKLVGKVRLSEQGPGGERYPDFEIDNPAAGFDGQSARIQIDDPGADSALDFNAGDSLTLEAWVSLNRISEGQQVYVVGKGRTGNKGFAAENQNYALRLRGTPDGGTSMAAVSFLFRDADNRRKGDPKFESDWHRWTSHGGFVEGSGWHHIAVTYIFGKSKSLRGYIDGQEVEGAWDMGGASHEAPVVDDDQLWIGSSMGGSATSSFEGLIDEVALYRSALSAEQLRRHYRANLTEPVVKQLDVPPGQVLVQVLEGLPDKHAWDFPSPRVTEQYVQETFALIGVPNKYSNKALVADRSSPFLVRAVGLLELPAGQYRVLLRTRGAARLFVDGRRLLETPFPIPNGNGHEDVPVLPTADEPDLRPLQIGHSEDLKPLALDGQPHEFRLETIVGGRKLRPELGEFSVSIARQGEPFRLLAATPAILLSDAGWKAYAAAQATRLAELNRQRRLMAGERETAYWQQRHELARQLWQSRESSPAIPQLKSKIGVHNDVDRFIAARLAKAGVEPAPLVDDAAFLRRLSLDTVGVTPTRLELEAFLAHKSPDRRQKAIDRLLADPRWADNWVGYWQDVLAENPGLVKPQLNNTGPFRWWIYESFLDNKPIDRFVTELVMMEGSRLGGGPAGFAMATQNDSPMAAKANIVAKAFLGVEMQCARCHDAPYHPVKQHDTFSIAAMLNKSPLRVPLTSTVKFAAGTRKPLVEVTLKPGSEVKPAWPFTPLASPELPDGVLREPADARERLAALLTAPDNERFPQVMVNRLWKRYLGQGLVEPVDDWTHADPSNPELLDYLASELVEHGYDLKHIARSIFSSHTYQRQVQPAADADSAERAALFASPTRRRLSAEQLVDSLFASVGKEFRSEELNLDPDGRRPQADFLNLGNPRRAWQFVSLSNERDRPALALPVAQSIIDLLMTFGWRESRQNPISQRELDPTVLQPLVLANGLVGSRVARLSDDSGITALSLEDRPLPELVQAVFRQILSRSATADEQQMFVELLAEGYADRRITSPGGGKQAQTNKPHAVSWSNHLSPEATRIKMEMERQARAGDPPTDRLQTDWRERMEDMLWSLVNSPEFAFVP